MKAETFEGSLKLFFIAKTMITEKQKLELINFCLVVQHIIYKNKWKNKTGGLRFPLSSDSSAICVAAVQLL